MRLLHNANNHRFECLERVYSLILVTEASKFSFFITVLLRFYKVMQQSHNGGLSHFSYVDGTVQVGLA